MSSPLCKPPALSETLSPRPATASPGSTTTPLCDPPAADVAASTPTPPALQRSLSFKSRASDSSPVADASRKLIRNVSPGLLARMKFLNQDQNNTKTTVSQIGRIPEDTIRELDEFHKDRTVRIERRGTTWTSNCTGNSNSNSSRAGTPLIPQLTGESAVMLAMDQSPPPGFESDGGSSLVSTSDRVVAPSDSDAEDTQKYRLPDLSSRTKTLSQPPSQPSSQPPSAPVDTDSSTEAGAARAPTPPPKDTPPLPQHDASVLDDHDGIDVAAYFHRRQFSRANSIYTLSRASFTNQIQQLTSITLPNASSLSSSISAIPTSAAAGRALHEAANQIKLWMAKATEVLDGLQAEDDVEWAAAAGREGLEEVDAAIGKFEGLVNVYITAIEDLQSRSDIAALPSSDLMRLMTQMEDVVGGWTKIKQTLKSIKAQVEIAMEWEELWNTVLGEIGQEVEKLSRHVFEMEERRHRAISESVAESAEKFDIAELETIVEETPRQHLRIQSNRFSLPAPAPAMSPISPIPQIEKENSRLLALFAKLQPLRASLDFLPMRLSSFHARASKVFPSACDELMRRKDVLEKQAKKLEADADALRAELGEDKWVHSFRQAGSKAIAMYDSLTKSIHRLRQAMDENDDEKLGTRIPTYKDKREHYPPSMKRVLELIDIEMKHRSTVNGETLRIQQDVRQKVADLEQETKDMDLILDEFTSSRKLRDSISTVLSASTAQSLTTSALDTPNSSPASSVIMGSTNYGRATPVKSRQASTSSSKSALPSRRYSSLPMSTVSNNVPRKSLAPPYSGPSRAMSSTPTGSVRSSSSTNSTAKPRWNSSTNMRDTVVGHVYNKSTPSPQKRDATPRTLGLRNMSTQSAIPVRSPLGQSAARPSSTTPAKTTITRRPVASTIQASPSTPAKSTHLSSRSATTPLFSTRTTPRISAAADEEPATPNEESPTARRVSARPASAMMTSRRSSLLPLPKQRTVSGSNLAALTGGTALVKPSSVAPSSMAQPAPQAAWQRSSSRLAAVEEAGKRSRSSLDVGRVGSRMGGRMSSLGGEGERRWR